MMNETAEAPAPPVPTAVVENTGMHRCQECGEDKPRKMFHGLSGILAQLCKIHYNEDRLKKGLNYCVDCKSDQPVEEFYRKGNGTFISPRCKTHHCDYTTAHAKERTAARNGGNGEATPQEPVPAPEEKDAAAEPTTPAKVTEMKNCNLCEKDLPLKQFDVYPKSGNPRPACKECRRKQKNALQRDTRRAVSAAKKADKAVESVVCRECKEELPVSDFYQFKGQRRKADCKPCHNRKGYDAKVRRAALLKKSHTLTTCVECEQYKKDPLHCKICDKDTKTKTAKVTEKEHLKVVSSYRWALEAVKKKPGAAGKLTVTPAAPKPTKAVTLPWNEQFMESAVKVSDTLSDNLAKQSVHSTLETLLGFIPEDVAINAMTFPGESCRFEEMLLKRRHVENLYLVERERKLMPTVVRNFAGRQKVWIAQAEVLEGRFKPRMAHFYAPGGLELGLSLEMLSRDLNVIWLDFMGGYSPEKQDSIATILKSCQQPKLVFAATLGPRVHNAADADPAIDIPEIAAKHGYDLSVRLTTTYQVNDRVNKHTFATHSFAFTK